MSVGSQALAEMTMPQLSGGRERARTLLAPLEGQVRDRQVRLDCRRLIAATSSFADELIRGLFLDQGAAGLIIEHASGAFPTYVQQAARDHGVSGQVSVL